MTLLSKLLGGASLAIAAFAGWQTIQLNGARDANRLLTEQLSTAKAEKALCSASVDALKQLADERQKRADDLLTVARKETVVHVERAADILKLPVPAPDAECQAAFLLLKEYQQ